MTDILESEQLDPTNIPGRRFGAFVIDLPVTVAASIATFFAYGPTTLPAGSDGCAQLTKDSSAHFCMSWGDSQYLLEGSRAGWFLLAIGGIWLAYHGVIQALVGTLGKRLLGLGVVGPDGQRAPMWRTLVRSLPLAVGASLVGIGFLVAAAVGFVMILVHPRHRRVGDVIARTYVVRREHVGQLTLPEVPRVGVAPPGD